MNCGTKSLIFTEIRARRVLNGQQLCLLTCFKSD